MESIIGDNQHLALFLHRSVEQRALPVIQEVPVVDLIELRIHF